MRDVIRGDVTFEHDALEDFVLLRGNGTPLFVLANVVDDIEMGITHVVRGEEHLPNTPKQQLLWRPSATSRRCGPTCRCSSTRRARSCRSDVTRWPSRTTATEGYLAEAMVNYLMTLGWAPWGDTEIVPWSRIEDEFRLEDVTHSPAYFDLTKLRAFNGEYIRAMPVEDFVAASEPWLVPQWDRDVYRASRRSCKSGSRCSARSRATSTSCSSEPQIDEAAWTKAMGPSGRSRCSMT